MSPNADATTLVDNLVAHLNERYLFPERARRPGGVRRQRGEEAAYAEAAGMERCDRISSDLLQASDDKHLRLIWHETPTAPPDQARLHRELREQIRRENHGVRRVELL